MGWNWKKLEWKLGAIFLGLLLSWWLISFEVKRSIQSVFQEIQAPIWYSADQLHQVGAYWKLKSCNKEELLRKIVELSRQLSYQELVRVATPLSSPEETAAIEEMDWQSLDGFQGIYARVVRRDEKTWWQELIVWAGAKDGVRENQAVIDGRGLVGRTRNVFHSHSVVELLTDPNFRIVAHTTKDKRPLIFEGLYQSGFRKPIGKVTHVPLDISASPHRPLRIVTSSLSGVYPEGIPIGVVTELKESDNGVFQEGFVHIDDRILQLREATIFIPLRELSEEF